MIAVCVRHTVLFHDKCDCLSISSISFLGGQLESQDTGRPRSFYSSAIVTCFSGLRCAVQKGKGPITLWFYHTWEISPACRVKWSKEEIHLSNSDKVEFVLLQMIQIIKFNKYPLSLYYVQGYTTLASANDKLDLVCVKPSPGIASL